jgi:ubiquinone/menaquinone biosynthesis C-methylase UbiE
MNVAETLFINSPLHTRELRQRIAPAVLELADPSNVHDVLEIGCGQGVGLELIGERFPGATRVGIDLDPKMVLRAQRRLGSSAAVHVGDVNTLQFADEAFDVVVDLAVLHHVPDWRGALGEVARVLRAGGQFVFVDYDIGQNDWITRTFFSHPDEHFTAVDFATALDGAGIAVDDRLVERNGEFIGAGRKQR